MGFPGSRVIKNSLANAGDTKDTGSIPGSGRSPGERNGNPLQYSCLENPMDRGAWRAADHGVAKNCTPLNGGTHANIQISVYLYTESKTFCRRAG